MSSDKIYFEDFYPGQTMELGTFSFTEAEIIEFASRYDPQFFHMRPDLAHESPFGGLIASGWHTCSQMMRLLVDNCVANSSCMGSPGTESLRWLRPVRAGDKIRTSIVVTEVRPSASKPDRGTVQFDWHAWNERDEQVVAIKGVLIYGRRPATDKGGEGHA